MTDYQYRYYDPVTGRWPSRDPIGEKSFYDAYVSKVSPRERDDLDYERFKSPYLMIDNDTIDASDRLGLERYITQFDVLGAGGSGGTSIHVDVAVDTWKDQNGKWVKSGTKTFGFSVSPFAEGYGFEDFYDGHTWSWWLLNPINIPLGAFSGTGLITEIDGLNIARPLRKQSTPCEDKMMLGKILIDKVRPPRYSALSFNCIHWATRAFETYWQSGLWQGRCCNPDGTVWKP